MIYIVEVHDVDDGWTAMLPGFRTKWEAREAEKRIRVRYAPKRIRARVVPYERSRR